MKKIFEQGETSSMLRMVEDQVSRILASITTMTNEIQVEVKHDSMEYFQQVKRLLKSLTNSILEKVPHTNMLQRVSKISTGKRVHLVHILPCPLMISNEGVDANMHQFNLISLDPVQLD